MVRSGPPAELLRAICERHGLGGAMERYPTGSLPVFRVETSRVLKLYPPPYSDEADTEAAALTAIGGRLSIPTPILETTGSLDGWRYIVMSQLPGESLREAWPAISPSNREAIVEALGRFVRELHAVDASGVPRPDWRRFVAEQTDGCVATQRASNLDERWVAQIPPFLEANPLPAAPPVLLHTEIMREHLLVLREGDSFRLAGIFDFEPAMFGAAEYEFASIGVFVTCGDRALFRRLLEAYGISPSAALSRRLLAYALLHRYSKLSWYLERLAPPPTVRTLDDLAREWWW